jgi:DNA-binding IclR family transcriptional regulator
VRRLDVESTSLPLLFFRGGYGRFAPLSLAADDSSLIKQLREVDLVRPEMERVVASISGARCNASVLVEDEIVVLASARGLESSSRATFVGERLPFIPPLGRVFAAWLDDAGLENWLQNVPSGDARTAEREWVAVVRRRGYSAIPGAAAWQWLDTTRARLATDPDSVDREQMFDRIRELHPEFVSPSQEVAVDIGAIRVPVFGPDGDVAMQLSVYVPPEPAANAAANIERVREAGRRATELLGGTVPPAD